ncbi:hypothetical protein H8E88_35945 [candidate division KSB1 bacterium]|nr:hypothetical protein [candidate division KSB1 bacterium]MBL7095891.1 hypothetical protein [candidate division KSB1 bacterium]
MTNEIITNFNISEGLFKIKNKIKQLPLTEQLWLLEQIAHFIRDNTINGKRLDSQLAAMAADPEIQHELKNINEEFSVVEMDGLEGL